MGPTEGYKYPLRPVWIQLLVVLNLLFELILSTFVGDISCSKLNVVVGTDFELLAIFLDKCLFLSAYFVLLIAPFCLL